MQHELAKLLVDVANDNDIDASLYENYSGRGMYGNTTTGLVVNTQSDLSTLLYNGAIAIAKGIESGELDPELSSIRSDNLGCDVIFY